MARDGSTSQPVTDAADPADMAALRALNASLEGRTEKLRDPHDESLLRWYAWIVARLGNDNTVKWQRLTLQLPPSRLRAHFVKATARVHEYPDGQLAVYWGPHRLADYGADGVLVQPAPGLVAGATAHHAG